MKRRALAVFTALILLLGSAGALAQPQADMALFSASIEGMAARGGAVIDGVPHGISKEEAESLGLVFEQESMQQSTNTAGTLTSEVYALDLEKCAIQLDGGQISMALFQFINNQLANITIYIPEEERLQSALKALNLEFGTENALEVAGDDFQPVIWEYLAGDRYGRVALGYQFREDGTLRIATLDFSYLLAEWYPHLYEKVRSGDS